MDTFKPPEKRFYSLPITDPHYVAFMKQHHPVLRSFADFQATVEHFKVEANIQAYMRSPYILMFSWDDAGTISTAEQMNALFAEFKPHLIALRKLGVYLLNVTENVKQDIFGTSLQMMSFMFAGTIGYGLKTKTILTKYEADIKIPVLGKSDVTKFIAQFTPGVTIGGEVFVAQERSDKLFTKVLETIDQKAKVNLNGMPILRDPAALKAEITTAYKKLPGSTKSSVNMDWLDIVETLPLPDALSMLVEESQKVITVPPATTTAVIPNLLGLI